jgi:hypothetical protein
MLAWERDGGGRSVGRIDMTTQGAGVWRRQTRQWKGVLL